MTLEERWEIALTATCGLPSCARTPGERCVNTVDGSPREEPHWNRWAIGRCTAARAPGACCDFHNEHCEPPGDLCCGRCTEASHDTFPIRHADGSRCVLTQDDGATEK